MLTDNLLEFSTLFIPIVDILQNGIVHNIHIR